MPDARAATMIVQDEKNVESAEKVNVESDEGDKTSEKDEKQET